MTAVARTIVVSGSTPCALLVVDIAQLLGLRCARVPELREERCQTAHDAGITLPTFDWRIQRLLLEHPLAQRVVRIARGRADITCARRARSQAALCVIDIAAQAVAYEIAVGVVAIRDAGTTY